MPPSPHGALPSERQIRWSELEFYNFLHFTINTFTDKEWGYGDESPRLFNPTSINADAIVETLKTAGSKGVILTCKHHDGFCLWPTRTTERSIRNSPYRDGKGDIVKEVSDAARRHGLKFGVYVSPWDRSQPSYGRPEYITIYRQQVRELLTGYGPIFEIWHDGANGGEGYYGGARKNRTINKLHYYGWEETWKLERALQPGAVLFSDVGPDIRWVGNEKGVAGETCWTTFTPSGPDGGPAAPGLVNEKASTEGTRDGKFWMPAECDVSIRPGWFWHAGEDSKVKTPRDLLELYYQSAGRGASFLLNVPPDRRGLLGDRDSESLRAFGRLVRATFAHNLAKDAVTATASNVREGDDTYGAKKLIDDRSDTFWSTDDPVTAAEVSFVFRDAIQFNLVRVRENIRLGQRVSEFAVDGWFDDRWSTLAKGTSIGSCRILRTGSPVKTSRVRLRIVKTPVCAALSEFGLFLEA